MWGGAAERETCINVNANVSIYLRTCSVRLADYIQIAELPVRIRHNRDHDASGLGIRVSKAIAAVILFERYGKRFIGLCIPTNRSKLHFLNGV